MELNLADYAVIFVIALSVLISIIRGFIKEAVSLATWVLAVLAVLQFTTLVASYLTEITDVPTLRLGLAALIIFVAVLIVGGIVNYIIGQLVESTGFSGTDRTLGAVFGLLRGLLVIGLVVIMASLTPFPQDPWWKQSYFLPKFQAYAVQFKHYLPEGIAENFNLEDPSATPAPTPVPEENTPPAKPESNPDSGTGEQAASGV